MKRRRERRGKEEGKEEKENTQSKLRRAQKGPTGILSLGVLSYLPAFYIKHVAHAQWVQGIFHTL